MLCCQQQPIERDYSACTNSPARSPTNSSIQCSQMSTRSLFRRTFHIHSLTSPWGLAAKPCPLQVPPHPTWCCLKHFPIGHSGRPSSSPVVLINFFLSPLGSMYFSSPRPSLFDDSYQGRSPGRRLVDRHYGICSEYAPRLCGPNQRRVQGGCGNYHLVSLGVQK